MSTARPCNRMSALPRIWRPIVAGIFPIASPLEAEV